MSLEHCALYGLALSFEGMDDLLALKEQLRFKVCKLDQQVIAQTILPSCALQLAAARAAITSRWRRQNAVRRKQEN